jgi:antitoxin ParD1/3/4
MPTRTVVLTDHHESVIETLVDPGRYRDASDLLREGLRLVERSEALEAAKLKALQGAAAVGFGDRDAGQFRDVESDELPEFIAVLTQRVDHGAGKSNVAEIRVSQPGRTQNGAQSPSVTIIIPALLQSPLNRCFIRLGRDTGVDGGNRLAPSSKQPVANLVRGR